MIGVFGVAGEVRVHLHNPGSTLLRAPRSLILVSPDGDRRPIRMSVRSGAGKRFLGRVEGVDDRDAAGALQGCRFAIPAAELPPEGDGEIYVHRLLGAEVLMEGASVGTLREIHDQGPIPLLEIAHGAEVAFVPLTEEFVERLSPDERRVWLRPGALVEG